MNNSVPVLAIDGPSGSGKGTLAAWMAAELGWHLLDSGALYRIVAAMAVRRRLDIDREPSMRALAESLRIAFPNGRVLVDDLDLTDEIRTEDMGVLASRVAALPAVRTVILAVQRDFAQAPGLVADGRDMGTVVFPHAGLKIFLDASAEARAERRYNQLKNKGLSVSLRDLLEQIQERDARDRERATAPLQAAHDAMLIDSTQMTIQEVCSTVMQAAKQQLL
ncbi:MAG: cytidylate kinase [Gammaproteobacteria bacterium]|nr:cytidylate kinase [Gammaproteobacteria bacterium]